MSRHVPKRKGAGRPVRGTTLRIIGGRFRGQSIRFNGDPATRPMKERVREAAFNLLGPAVRGKPVIDLFAGTGAMALEALSRGATHATLVERRFPNARVIEQNAAGLELSDRVVVVAGDAFGWVLREFRPGDQPLVVFCCPPYDFYEQRLDDMRGLLDRLVDGLATGSLLVVESDQRFDCQLLPCPEQWDVRSYPPAVISILEVDHEGGATCGVDSS